MEFHRGREAELSFDLPGKVVVCVYDLPEFPPVGTRCMYRNDALGLEGWGVIAAPRDPGDADDLPYLTPWVGTLVGPIDGDQVALDRMAPGCGTMPGVDVYRVVPTYLLWV